MQLNRRWFLGGGAAAALVVGAGGPAWGRQGFIPPGPGARIEPVSETFFGQTVVDPYRWMENPADPDWAAYLADNARHSRAAFDAMPGRPALAERLERLNRGFAYAWPAEHLGDREVFRRQETHQDQPVIYLREGGRERVVLDINALSTPERRVTLAWWWMSPDGRHIVYGLSDGNGDESAVLHLMDIDTGEQLPETMDRCGYAMVSWLPDSSGFFYTRTSDAPVGSAEYFTHSTVWLHRLRTDPSRDRPIIVAGQDAQVGLEARDLPIVFADPSSPWVLAASDRTSHTPIWKARLDGVLAGAPVWQQVCRAEDGVYGFMFRGDTAWLSMVTAEGGNELVSIDLRDQPPMRIQSLMNEPTRQIRMILPTSNAVYVGVTEDGYAKLYRLGSENAPYEVQLPIAGTIAGWTFRTDSPRAYMVLTSWLEPPTVWRLEADGVLRYADLAPPPSFDTAPYEVIRQTVRARDGIEVPLSIIAPRNLRRDGQAVALVEAYGAYQASITPGFDPQSLALLEQGGVVAYAHVRGGGEKGIYWWAAGWMENKPNTWRDLIDCCEHLVREGFTSPRRLGITGSSAGGIAVGRAMTERPDLFGLVVSEVGLLNPLRAEFEPSGPGNVAEFGTLTTQEGFQALSAMDSLHHVQEGVVYPTVILAHGLNDVRVSPWQSAKMTARLRAVAGPDSGPVLFRVEREAGHGVVTRGQSIAKRADIYSTLLSLRV